MTTFPKTLAKTFDSKRFDKAYVELAINEGGFSDNPNDKGGKTIYGISSKSFPKEYAVTMELIKNNKPELAKEYAKNFYRRVFWNPYYDWVHDDAFAFRIFDLSINKGKEKTIMQLQRFLNKYSLSKLKVDGVFGKDTLGVLNFLTVDVPGFYDLYIEYNKKIYSQLADWVYFKTGWLRRLYRKVYLGNAEQV